MRISLKKVLCIIEIVFTLWACGCGSSKTTTDTELPQHDVTFQEIDCEVDEANFVGTDDAYFYYSYQTCIDSENDVWSEAIYRQAIEDKAEKKQLIEDTEDTYWIYKGISTDSEQNIHIVILSGSIDSTNKEMQISDYDKDGNLINTLSLTDTLFVFSCPLAVCLIGENEYAVILQRELCIVDDWGSIVERYDCPEDYFQQLAYSGPGFIMAHTMNARTGSQLAVFDIEKRAFTSSLTTIGNSPIVLNYGENDELLYINGENLCIYKASCNAEGVYCNVVRQGVNPNELVGIYYGNERCVAWCESASEKCAYKCIELTKTDGNEVAYEEDSIHDYSGRKIVRLLSTYEIDQYFVEAYNDQSNDYVIEVMNESFDDDRDIVEFITGDKCPDLVTTDDPRLLYALFEGGYLADLKEYLNEENGVPIDKLDKHIVDEYTNNGTLYAIPDKYMVGLIEMNASLVNSRTAWNYEEFLQCISDNKDAYSNLYCKPVVFSACLDSLIDDCVDYSDCSAHFSEGPFKDFLNGLMSLDIRNDYMSAAEVEAYVDNRDKHSTMINEISLSGLTNVCWRNAQSPVETDIIGYPNAEGNEKAYLLATPLSILNNSKCKSGAADVLAFYLIYSGKESNQLADVSGMASFYTYSDYMERNADILYGKNEIVQSYINYDDITVTIRKEDIDKALHYASISHLENYSKSAIRKIVEEETEGIFESGRDISEVCDIIQNRVQILLDEQKNIE